MDPYSLRHTGSNNRQRSIRTNLATPFHAPPTYQESQSSSSIDAVNDADDVFRPFPERSQSFREVERNTIHRPPYPSGTYSTAPNSNAPYPTAPYPTAPYSSASYTRNPTRNVPYSRVPFTDAHIDPPSQQPEVPSEIEISDKEKLKFDSATSSRLLHSYRVEHLAKDEGREFRFMQFMPVTCEPENFTKEGYALRQQQYNNFRETEILVCITLYNEEPHLIARTLRGVMQNISHLDNKEDEPFWHKKTYRKIVVCFIADGRHKINDKTLAFFSSIGVFQDGFAMSKFDGVPITAHFYEHTTHIMPKKTEETKINFKRSDVPAQLILCLKEKNKKKINSHRWCFQAICESLKPNIVVLLDAGTQPSRTSLYHLWREFDTDKRVAGCCGEIKAALGANCKNLLNPLVASQNFEYKMSNILDKPTESSFGFVSVLPGAFSAYKYIALKGRPLEQYFKGETLDSQKDAGVFQKNMYLAEDRILCFELITKKNENWILRYVKAATADTDTPTSIEHFIKQRRRWLNGSFFVSFYSLINFYRIWSSGHSVWRKLLFQVEFLYQAVQFVVSWFAIGSFFLVFRIISVSLDDYFKAAKYLAGVFLWLYVASTIITFVLSFGNRPEGTAKAYKLIFIFYAVLMGYTIFAATFMSVKAVQDFKKVKDFHTLVFEDTRFRDLAVSTASTYVLYFVSSFLYFEPWHMFTSFVQYILISPSYINVLNIYAFCNLHDVTWGNRDTDPEPGQEYVSEIKGNKVKVRVPLTVQDVNDHYSKRMEQLESLGNKEKTPKSPREQKAEDDLKTADFYALNRTLVVLFWMATNGALIAVVLSRDGFTKVSSIAKVYERRSEIFLTVILWIVAFTAAFRFLGCIWYLITRLTHRMAARRRVSEKYPV